MEPLSLQYLLEANKAELQGEIVARSCQGYDLLLLDRYLLSGIAHGVVRGIPEEDILALQKPLIPPDYTILFDLPAEMALGRSQAITERDEQDVRQLEAVRQTFLRLMQHIPGRVIDATRDANIISDEVLNCLIGQFPQLANSSRLILEGMT